MALGLARKPPPVACAQDAKQLSSRRETEKERQGWGCGGVFFNLFVYLFIFSSLAGGTEGKGEGEGGFTADSREQEKQERKLEGFYVK